MIWAILYRETVKTWKLYPDTFPTRAAARFACRTYPDVGRYHERQVVAVKLEQKGPEYHD